MVKNILPPRVPRIYLLSTLLIPVLSALLIASPAVANMQPQFLEKAQYCVLNTAPQTEQNGLNNHVGVNLTLELARTTGEIAKGLMHRESLESGHGMLFIYTAERKRAFWMFQTLLPLDIAYIDQHGVILETLEMEPCRSIFASRCPNYPSAYPFMYALEMQQGEFAKWGIVAGTQLKEGSCEVDAS